MTDRVDSGFLVNIQNKTDKVIATNVFNTEDLSWDQDTQPSSSLHERVIQPHTEITEPSRESSLSSSYHIGLTVSDGGYLQLTLDHGVLRGGDHDPTQAETEREVCEVAGSLEKYRVERCLTDDGPTTLVIQVFDIE